MTYSFKFPDVGEGITEGQIVKWHVAQGQTVAQDQVLCEIETDKAIIKIPSPKAGTIATIYKNEGEAIQVGEVLVDIEEDGDPKKILGAPALFGPHATFAPLPESAGQSRAQTRRFSSTVIGELEEAPEDEEPTPIPKTQTPYRLVLAMPSVRKLCRELDVDIEKIQGSGTDGRVLERDVRAASQGVQVSIDAERTRQARTSPSAGQPLQPPPAPGIGVEKKYDLYGFVERVQLQGIRKAISQHMDESHLKTASVTHMDEADITHLFEVHEREKAVYEQKGVKLTYLPFIIKAVILALRNHPYLNASLDDKTGEIVLKKYFNIGVACDTPEGLIVPVIKNAHQKSIVGLAKEIRSLATQARERTINAMDLKGGTFTITNLGAIGGTFFTPIINYPEAAILGIGRLTEKVVVKEKTLDVRHMLPLSLTYDHRVVDGAEAARFLNEVKEHLENPEGLFLEMEF